MIDRSVAAAFLDAYFQASDADAADAWREYVRAVRHAATDPNAPPEMADEARMLIDEGLDENCPPDRYVSGDDDPPPTTPRAK